MAGGGPPRTDMSMRCTMWSGVGVAMVVFVRCDYVIFARVVTVCVWFVYGKYMSIYHV